MPEDAPGAKRLLVPESLWDFIHQTAITVKPDDHVGCSTFPSDSELCALCSVTLKEAAFSEGNLRLFNKNIYLVGNLEFRFAVCGLLVCMLQRSQVEAETES